MGLEGLDIKKAGIEIVERYDPPTKQGTVAIGFINWRGEKYAYRQVRWSKDVANRVILLANQHAGTWDAAAIMTGFSTEEIQQSGLTDYFASNEGYKEFADEISGVTSKKKATKKEYEPAPLSELSDDLQMAGVSTLSVTTSRILFPTENRFGIPDLRHDMLADITAKPIGVWVGKNYSGLADYYFYIYPSYSTKDLDYSKTVIAFYTYDERWENDVWNDTAVFTHKMLNAKISCLVAPNFSHYIEMPQAERIYNYYRSMYIARFWQESGLKVIPDLKLGYLDEDYPYIGIPKRAPVIATQFQVSNSAGREEHTSEKKKMLMDAIDFLKPSKILLYGSEYGIKESNDAIVRAGIKRDKIFNVLSIARTRGNAITNKKKADKEAGSVELL